MEKRLRKQRIFLRWDVVRRIGACYNVQKRYRPEGAEAHSPRQRLGERSQPMKVRPEGAKEWLSLYNCLLPLQGAFSLGRVTQGAASLALGYV
ncbi:MAG: hypothetical protein J6X32_04690 [Salinivirgaceae bacterium]|nr:hypothetical protein [Salinivirgaceae bacterium]